MNQVAQTKNQDTKTNTPKADEKILVVARKWLFPTTTFNGFLACNDFESYQLLINQHQEFRWRSEVENDPSYKQIIPYLVFEYNKTFFLMRRRTTASEQRLKDKYSLGIGGHLRQEDLSSNNLFDWAQREFFEEINYEGSVHPIPLGLINDESNSVGQVHIGFVFLLQGTSNNIAIKDEHKEGRLVTLDECLALYENLESWSKFVYDHLKKISSQIL